MRLSHLVKINNALILSLLNKRRFRYTVSIPFAILSAILENNGVIIGVCFLDDSSSLPHSFSSDDSLDSTTEDDSLASSTEDDSLASTSADDVNKKGIALYVNRFSTPEWLSFVFLFHVYLVRKNKRICSVSSAEYQRMQSGFILFTF